jgi:predicted transcriptional regulator
MTDAKPEMKSSKEALKKLREARREIIERASPRMKGHIKAVDALKKKLREGGKTVPELAAETGISTSDVMWYIAALKKYGEVVEGDKDGSYFRYELARNAEKPAENSESPPAEPPQEG